MARMSRLLGAVCLGAAATAAVAAMGAMKEFGHARTVPAAHAESQVSGRVIVKFRTRAQALSAATGSGASTGPHTASVLGARLGLSLKDGRALGERTQVLLASGTSSSALAAKIAADADVEWAVPDRRAHVMTAPNDPLYPNNLSTAVAPSGPAVGQWYLRAPDATVKSGINIEQAWAVTTNGESSVAGSATGIVVADIDTGITVHPELQNKLFYNGAVPYGYDFIGYVSPDAESLATANDGDQADPDPSDPGDWVSASDISGGKLGSGCTASDEENSSWHGTQTAGILGAATNNGIGMASVGYDTMVVPVRALGKCGGFDSDIIAAAQWAGGIAMPNVPTNTHPARVINMSLGGDEDCQSDYQDALTALRNKGVVVVVAAGNGTAPAADPNDTEGSTVFEPADCKPAATDPDQTPIVVAVAGLRHAGTKVGFSNLGPTITISAPGGNCVNTASNLACLYPILTTANTGTTSPADPTYTTSFGTPSLGTSFSTPMVAGTLALMFSAAPTLTNAQAISILKSTASPFPTTSDTGITAVCTDPGARTSPTRQDECICTTSTCGAGMLNAGLAVATAAGATGATSQIDTPANPLVGQTVVFDGSGSTASAGATVTGYAWTVVDGASVAAITGSAASPTVTLQANGPGAVTVKLVTTDSAGKIGVAFRTVFTDTPTAAISGAGSVVVGSTLQLSGTTSTSVGSHTVTGYAWSVSPANLATLSSTTGSAVVLTGVAAGTATVTLTVTDDAGATASTTATVTVTAPATTTGSGTSSGGGGGAANPAWLVALVVAGLLLTPRARRRRAD